MKKVFFILFFLFAIMAFAVASASIVQDNYLINKRYTNYEQNNLHTINLPTSLEIIEDEAFDGTSITYINLPESLIIIGERAFANIRTLLTIHIPISTTSIAKTAFVGSNYVTITAAPNSYARAWAKENRIPFSPITVVYAGTGTQSITASLSSISKGILDTESSETKDTNRSWRKLEEIQVHDTIEIIANVVQGRAPPMA